MVVWLDYLDVHLALFFQKLDDRLGCNVVQDVELWLESSTSEVLYLFFERLDNRFVLRI